MIKDYVIKAKQGDKQAYDYLINYYKKYFVKKVVSIYGKEYEEKAKNDFKIILDNFLSKDYKTKFYNYMFERAKVFYLSDKERRARTHYITSKLENLNEENYNKLLDHYTNIFLDKIRNYNNILTEDELKILSYKIVDEKLKGCINNYTKGNIIVGIASKIHNEINLYKNDEDMIIKKYISYFDVNDKIVDYITKKYLYLMEDNNNKNTYYRIEDNYKDIVRRALVELKNNGSDYYKIKSLILLEMKKERIKMDTKNRKLQLNKDLIVENSEYLKQSYSYMIDQYYDLYKDIIKDENLRLMIEEKYNEFFDCYIKGDAKSPITKYIPSRLSAYLIHMIKNENNKVDEKIVKEQISNNYNIFYQCLKNFRGYFPLYDELEKYYKESCYEYFKAERKTEIDEYLYARIMKYIYESNVKYNDEYLNSVISFFMNNKMMPDYLMVKYFSELKKYYLDNKLYEKIAFDEYLFNELKSFDLDEYLKIENASIKLLKRP